MLGWHVSVYRQQNDGTTPAPFSAPHGARLAVWQAGLGGLKWLDELVAGQKAINLGGTGYPCEYTAPARDVITIIRVGPPMVKTAWPHDTDAAVMDSCRPDEWLIIQAWDES